MTRIGFYIVADAAPLARLKVACRLISKSYDLQLRTFVHVADQATCTRMDELLWTFRDQSFIPHEIAANVRASDTPHAPVVIGYDQEPAGDYRYLVNLADDVPHFFSRFEKAAEIIDQSADTVLRGRDRFRFYRDRGYPIETHNI